MDWSVKAFVKASLAWLALGVTLGVAMAARPGWAVYRPAHLHMTLLGFVAMMIYGVAHHVIPRFVGHPLHSRRLAGWHWWWPTRGWCSSWRASACVPRQARRPRLPSRPAAS
jgi:cbb3-type cytochrome oxidase subunit 1